MRSLAEIVSGNRLAKQLGVELVTGAVGTEPEVKNTKDGFVNQKLSPDRLRKLGLDKY